MRETTPDEPDQTPAKPTDERIITDTPVLEAPLPEDVQTLLGRLLGDDPIQTLGDWVTAVRDHTGGGAITIEELCQTDTETPHWGTIDDTTYYFHCFYDAVILAALVSDPVDIHTESPDGTVIEATAAGTTHLQVTPADAVFSFGVTDTIDPPTNRQPSNADVYAAVCPYVQAFPNTPTYTEWAERVPAATIALPLDGATHIAAGLVD